MGKRCEKRPRRGESSGGAICLLGRALDVAAAPVLAHQRGDILQLLSKKNGKERNDSTKLVT